jgi:hypothetical protein
VSSIVSSEGLSSQCVSDCVREGREEFEDA